MLEWYYKQYTSQKYRQYKLKSLKEMEGCVQKNKKQILIH